MGVLGKRDATVVGIDSSPEFLREAKRIAPQNCEFVLASGSHMCFKRGTFDEVHCHHVLEHVPDLDSALDNMAESIVPKGKLYISVPHPFLEKILANLKKGYIGEQMHRRIIDSRDLTLMLRSRGIGVKSVEKRKFFIACLLTYTFMRGLSYEPQSGLLEREDAITKLLDKIIRWTITDPDQAEYGRKSYIKGLLILANIKDRVMSQIYPHENYMEAIKE